MFGWFSNKKEVDRVKEETRQGFESVKKDVDALTGWIKHLESERNSHEKELFSVKEDLSSIKDELENIKNILTMATEVKSKKVFKTPKQLSNKQTAVYPVQTAVQTAVQTPNLDSFSITERSIIWVLLNTDMKLSYDDIAAILGKERSTIRGQINSIKQKSEGERLIHEQIEKNGKKRVYIPEEIREKVLKKSKVRVKQGKKSQKK